MAVVSQYRDGLMETAKSIAYWRERFPVTKTHTYLDHARVGPLAAATRDAAADVLRAQASSGSLAFDAQKAAAEKAREKFALLIGAAPDEIAMMPNTSTAISTIANGLAWRPGDIVLVADIEYPANVYPWSNLVRRGVQIRKVATKEGRITVDDFAAGSDKHTRAIAVSLIQFSNGYRVDLYNLAEFCRSRKIRLIVDAMQALGAINLDVRELPVDFLAAASNKWLCGPFGVGWLFVRRELISTLEPTSVGLLSVTPRASFLDHTFTLKPDAGRFENGVLNLPGVIGAGVAADLLREADLAAVERRTLFLATRLDEGLRQIGCTIKSPRAAANECSAIVTFQHPTIHATACHRKLAEAGIVTSQHEGAIRISPHFYNTIEEIDHLVDTLRTLSATL